MPASLYLIPSALGEAAPIDTLPPATLAILRRLEHLVVETPKQARRFLKTAGVALATNTLRLHVLDEHTPDSLLPELLAPALAGADIGVLSDAGCPGVADPGAKLVLLAHTRGVRVIPLVGPSAILLALMASGMNGQRFAFHGYLPIEAGERVRVLRSLEKVSRSLDQTQIVIETPYRNIRLLQAMLQTLSARTLLCIAVHVTLPTERIETRTIQQWRRLSCPEIDRRPAVFLFGAASDESLGPYAQ